MTRLELALLNLLNLKAVDDRILTFTAEQRGVQPCDVIIKVTVTPELDETDRANFIKLVQSMRAAGWRFLEQEPYGVHTFDLIPGEFRPWDKIP